MKRPKDLLERYGVLGMAGAPGVDDGPLPEAVANGVRRAHGGRLPGEARPALEPIRKAAVPSLVASGDHTPGIERICDPWPSLSTRSAWSPPAQGISSPRRQGSPSGSSGSSSRRGTPFESTLLYVNSRPATE